MRMIFSKTELYWWRTDQWLSGGGGGDDVTIKYRQGELFGVMELLYILTATVVTQMCTTELYRRSPELMLSAQTLSRIQLFCDPIDCSLPGSSVHGRSQSRILERVAISFSMGSSWSKDWIHVFCISCIGRRIVYHWATKEAPSWFYCTIITGIYYICAPTELSSWDGGGKIL